jgi:hypothetical protein
MNAIIEIDDQTYRSLEFAAQVAHTTVGQVVTQLVQQASAPKPVPRPPGNGSRQVAIFVDYDGHRTRANFDLDTSRIDITSGPLRGQSFKSPSEAAVAVIRHHKPEVDPNRNGWKFWRLDDGTKGFLAETRPDHPHRRRSR